MKFSSLAALKVVILTTFSAASDEHFIKMKTFPLQWISLGMHPANEKRRYIVTTYLIGWVHA